MALRPKNWTKFQHYKDRRPAWIKLHHDILVDHDLWSMRAEDYRYLTFMWLIASEELGDLPEMKDLAFRLRMPLAKCEQLVKRLSPFLEHSASKTLANPLATCSDSAIPEKEREKEEEKEREKNARLAPLSSPPGYDFTADPVENIPEGLSPVEYVRVAMEVLQIAHTRSDSTTLEAALLAIAKHEKLTLGQAAKVLIQRARDDPQEPGKPWSWWVTAQRWKKRGDVYGTFSIEVPEEA